MTEKKISQTRIARELELKNFLFRISKLHTEGKLSYADCTAIMLRRYNVLYPEIGGLWPTYFPGKEWQGEFSNVADCKILYCPECDTFKAVDQYEYRSNAKLTRSRLCVVCINKWRKNKKKGKLPYQEKIRKYGPQPVKVYQKKEYESRKIPPKPQIPKDIKPK